jgi:hypothetical protein
MTEQVSTVRKDFTLDLSCRSYDGSKVKETLAAQYRVDSSSVTVSNPCATRRLLLLRARMLQANARTLTMTITLSDASLATDLVSAIQAVDDPTLGSMLSAALGASVRVAASTSATLATVQRVVSRGCPRGFWCTAGLVVACEIGFYNPTEKANSQSACIQCPDQATTSGTNSTSRAQCICAPKFFDADFTEDGVHCARCPVGTACLTPGVTLLKLPLKAGYYRKSNTSMDVRSCKDRAVGCPPGMSECPQSNSACAGGDSLEAQCRPELTGIYCQLCANKSKAHFIVPASEASPATCLPCDESFVLPATISVASVATLPAFLYGGLKLWHRLPAWFRNKVIRRWSLYRLGTKIKVLFSFYQIACKVEVVYQVSLPASVRALLKSLEVYIYLGFDFDAPYQCLGATSYLQRLQFWIFAPIALALLLCMIGSIIHCNARTGVTWALPFVIKMMFLCYTTVNLRAFEAFRCYDFGDDGQFLVADVEVRCNSPQHTFIKRWAWVGIFLYPVGWTAATALLLLAARRSIMGKRKRTALSHALRFVYGEYEVCTTQGAA